jgi:hypothetical protein
MLILFLGTCTLWLFAVLPTFLRYTLLQPSDYEWGASIDAGVYEFWSKQCTKGNDGWDSPCSLWIQPTGKYYKNWPTEGFTVPTSPNKTLSPAFPHVSVGPKPTLYTCKLSTTLLTFTMKKEAACTSKTLAALLTYTQCRDPITASTLKTNNHKSLKLVTSGFHTEIRTWPVARPSSQAD